MVPPPVGGIADQKPAGLPQRPDQMGNGTIDANHQIEFGDHRRCIDEIVQIRPQRGNPAVAGTQNLSVAGA